MITKSTLEQWRREALISKTEWVNDPKSEVMKTMLAYEARIIRLTAELLDQHLMKR